MCEAHVQSKGICSVCSDTVADGVHAFLPVIMQQSFKKENNSKTSLWILEGNITFLTAVLAGACPNN